MAEDLELLSRGRNVFFTEDLVKDISAITYAGVSCSHSQPCLMTYTNSLAGAETVRRHCHIGAQQLTQISDNFSDPGFCPSNDHVP